MSIRQLYVAALCLGFLTYSCLSAIVISENGQSAGEENKDALKITSFQNLEAKEEDINSLAENSIPDIPNKVPKPGVSLSQGENDPNEESKSDESSKDSSSSSESSEDSSRSEEKSHKKILQKRSLDSKQDALNSIGEDFNQTSVKENINSEKNESLLLEATTPTTDESESDISSNNENIRPIENKNSPSPTFKSPSESTTSKADVTHVTEDETSESGSEITAETTTETTESSTTTETEFEEITPSKIESENSSEIQSETTVEYESTTIQTTEASKDEDSSSENNDEIYRTTSSTSISESESSKSGEDQESSFIEMAMEKVSKMSDQIRQVLIYYRKAGVVVIPGQSFFPEPMPMQDFRQSFSVGTMDFKNTRVYGLSNFTVEHINTDVDRMQVYILLHMKRLVILGNYTLRTFFSRAAGPFNVTLLNVDSEGVAEIETASEGHLQAADSVMDMFTKDMRIDFKNLGFMGSMFQGVISTVGDALFNSIKPQILERVNLVIRTDVNKKLKEFSTKFINKVNPVDLAFSEGRKYVKEHGYDPYNIRDHTFILGGLVYVNITEFWVEGLSKFFRVGNLSLSMDSGVIEIGIHVMTQKLTGHCSWSGETFGIIKTGKTHFTVDHLQVKALVNQSLDVRTKPQLEDLDLELGWVKVKMDSPMTLNLMIEGVINAFPRLIRHIIVDTLEQPLKEKIQEILNKINVESVVDENLPRLDSFGL